MRSFYRGRRAGRARSSALLKSDAVSGEEGHGTRSWNDWSWNVTVWTMCEVMERHCLDDVRPWRLRGRNDWWELVEEVERDGSKRLCINGVERRRSSHGGCKNSDRREAVV